MKRSCATTKSEEGKLERPSTLGILAYDKLKEESFRRPPRDEVNQSFFLDEVEVFFGIVHKTPKWRKKKVFSSFIKYYIEIWPHQWKRLHEVNNLLRECVKNNLTSVGSAVIAITTKMLRDQKKNHVINANKERRAQGMEQVERKEKYYLPIMEFSDKTTDKNIARRDKITLFREYFDKYWEENEDEIRKKSRPRRKSANEPSVQESQSRPCKIHKTEFDNFRTAYYRWAKNYKKYEKITSLTDMINKLMLNRQD